jgi:putative nucleotidyltransferase with HDIG domain
MALRAEPRVGQGWLFPALLLLGSSWIVFALPTLLRTFPTSIFVALICALCASLLTIPLNEDRVRLSLEAPFLAGLWLLGAPAWAVVGVGLVCASLPVFRSLARHHAVNFSRYLLNLVWVGVAVCAGIAVGSFFEVPWVRAEIFVLVATAVGLVPLVHRRPKLRDISPGVWIDGLAVAWSLVLLPVAMSISSPVVPVVALIEVMLVQRFLLARQSVHRHYVETLVGLMLMLQRAHPYTHGHLDRVSNCAEKVALKLGLGRQRAAMVKDAAILHDIGKIAVDEAILDKPAKLTEAEFDHVKRHSSMGANILAECPAFEEIVPWVMHHHERPDGNGYPDRLRDEHIPIESKIIAVVDAFDAMVGSAAPGGKRTYREPMSLTDALLELDRCSGTQFDPSVVRAFREVVMEGGL